MRYKTQIKIHLPRERVVELFDNIDNKYNWIDGLKEIQLLDGEHNQPGAKCKLLFDVNCKEKEVTEIVTVRNLPDEFSKIYIRNYGKIFTSDKFLAAGPSKTKWISENEIKFSGIFKILALFNRSSYTRDTENLMNNFKTFAENI